jgi:GDP-mannose 6-dehydrogenase
MVGDIGAVLTHAQTVVIGNNDPEFRQVPARLQEDQQLVDFVGIVDEGGRNGNYDGICW